jgi:glucan 1,3-beta-glucosidase
MLTRALPIAAAVAAVAAAAPAAPYRGVNVGGWMVLESWIRPSLFKNHSVPGGVGEWQFCAAVGGPAACCDVLAEHWADWFTDADVAALAAGGVTHLRIPLGYWILGNTTADEPFCTAGWPVLVQRLTAAAAAGVRVVLDLHGAPGSQNGHDNSGTTGSGIGWDTPANRARTTAYLVELAARAAALNAAAPTAGVVAAIELLNEPWTTAIGGPIALDDLAAWYATTITAMRAAGGWAGDIWLSDGWDADWAGWAPFLSSGGLGSLVFDTHIYHCFGGGPGPGGYANLTAWGQLDAACTVDGPGLRKHAPLGATPLVVGEYSLALPSTLSPPSPWDHDDVAFYRSFASAQMHAYGALGPAAPPASGGFFWCHRTESSPEWSYLDGMAGGWVSAHLATSNASRTAFACDYALQQQ